MAKLTSAPDLCQGYANCIMAADDLYDIDDEGTVVLLVDSVPESERERAEKAARTCPVSALGVEDD